MERTDISMKLRVLNNAVRRYIDRNFDGMEELEHLTCSNGWIIGMLSDAEVQGTDVYQRDFEEKFGITRSTASKVLILLEKKGVIERVAVAHDARLKKIVLADKAREYVSRLQENGERMERQLARGFSDGELDTLYSYLDRIQANLDRAEREQKE